MKKIVIINGNPDTKSFCHAIQNSYKKGAEQARHEVKELTLSDMSFNPNLAYGYRKRTDLEPDLLDAWDKLKWSDHIVWLYPTWWGTVPAILKGFIDRMFLPGFAYEYQEKSPFPKKLLIGKTSEIISTMDTPIWYYKWVYKDIGGRLLKKNLGDFCGIKNKRTTYLSPIKNSTSEQRIKWLEKIENLAIK